MIKEIADEKPSLSKRPPIFKQEDELRTIDIAPTEKNWIRVALVQLSYQLSFNRPPREFGYKLLQREEVKTKLFKALNFANENKVDIICFPELCINEEWITEIRNKYSNLIVIFGSYYTNAFNRCPIIIEGQDYYIQKINPSPHSEKDVTKGRCMKRGKERIIFQTRYGRFVVLICQDFYGEINNIIYKLDKEGSFVDFVFVPARNRASELYQKRADQVCQDDNFPFIFISNALEVNDEKAGGTCIIGTDHNGALKRYQNEGWKPKDEIKYKLLEAKGESVIVADLDIKTKGVRVPPRDFKMRNPMIYKIT